MENEPLGDITRSDVKDAAANNNTKQLFTVVVPRRKVARLTTRFYTFPPYILFKRRQGTRQFYPTKFIKWVPKPGPTQFYCTYKYRLELFTKYCHWKAVCEHGGQLPSLKTLTPDLFIIIFFYCLLHTRTLITLTFHLHICRDRISPSQIYINTIRISRGKIRKRAYLKKSIHGRG